MRLTQQGWSAKALECYWFGELGSQASHFMKGERIRENSFSRKAPSDSEASAARKLKLSAFSNYTHIAISNEKKNTHPINKHRH